MKYFGQIKAFNPSENTIVLKLDDLNSTEKHLFDNNLENYLEIDFDDKRVISYKQRRKVYALLHSIAQSTGVTANAAKDELKKTYCKEKRCELFSLSNCSVKQANDFIDYLVNFCLAWDVEFASKALDVAKDSYGWEYNCLMNHKCAICGKRMQIAHVHAIGMGANRNKMRHIGYSVMPLCVNHHHEQHSIGIKTFLNKYALSGVRVTKDIARFLKIGRLNGEFDAHTGDDINYSNDHN